ncbi:MAG: hypothetical protein IJI25_08750 [Eubacterium sp.]|nr:hypothetical protein [Eubacterium sp.]
MNASNFCWVNIVDVPVAVINDFDSGNAKFNEFLKERARDWQTNGEAVTYLIVTEKDLETKTYTRIYGYVSINTMGLLYISHDGGNRYLPCAEIRMFAISRNLRKHHDPTITYSDTIFKLILQNLYELSTSVIGFRAIFLNANHEGFQLYTDNNFRKISELIPPTEEEKLDIDGTTPMLLPIDDKMIYDIFS